RLSRPHRASCCAPALHSALDVNYMGDWLKMGRIAACPIITGVIDFGPGGNFATESLPGISMCQEMNIIDLEAPISVFVQGFSPLPAAARRKPKRRAKTVKSRRHMVARGNPEELGRIHLDSADGPTGVVIDLDAERLRRNLMMGDHAALMSMDTERFFPQ